MWADTRKRVCPLLMPAQRASAMRRMERREQGRPMPFQKRKDAVATATPRAVATAHTWGGRDGCRAGPRRSGPETLRA